MSTTDQPLPISVTGPDPTPATARSRRRAQGQIIVIFAAAIVVFMGLAAVVIDVSWFLSSEVKMQRAADAAALAGVVLLPGNVPGAVTLARTEASRNGYTSGVNGITVTPTQDTLNTRRMQVVIDGPVNTYFARVLGIASFNANVTSKAEYILPVPMGSPENYYGVFGLTRGLTQTATTTVNQPQASTADSGFRTATSAPDTVPVANGWTASGGVGTADQQRVAAVLNNDANASQSPYVWTNANGNTQIFGGFDLSPVLAGGEVVNSIRGLQVYLDDYFLSAACGTSRIQVQASEDAGANWSNPVPITTTQTGPMPIGANNATAINFGSANNFTAWTPLSGGKTWNAISDFSTANFRVRLTAVKGCAGGVGSPELRLDQLRVVATYNTTKQVPVTTTTTTTLPDINLQGPGTACGGGVANCANADGATLNPRGFWGTLNSQGAANINGDAYQPNYDTPTSGLSPNCNTITTVRACYSPNEYYNYAVEMPQGASGGEVWIYDPGFCAVATDHGTGDRWFGGTNGVTTMYEVWDTNNTLYDRGDDGIGFNGTTPNATSGNLFRQISASDSTMGGSGGNECRYTTTSNYGDGRDYHDHWFRLMTGMVGGSSGPKIYRVHTTSTDPAAPTQQQNTNAENSFAIYATAAGGSTGVKVYGLGAMQAFTPLTANNNTTSSEFYLAQIDKVHAGKTVEISLWDPGDTDPLTASIEIEIPNGANSWTATPVTYTAATGTNNSGRADGTGGKPNCNTNSRTTESTAPISTYTQGTGSTTGKFNGCWITIDAVIPDTYQALASGWWKIKYTMTGTGTSNDVTTWKVQILGNPVHLIVN